MGSCRFLSFLAVLASVGTVRLDAQTPEASRASDLPDWLKRLTVSGTAYLRYGYELAGSAKDFNEFNLNRIYLRFDTRLWDKGSVRYTLEGGDLRAEGARQPLAVATKHFYLEVRDALHKHSYLRFGLADLPWVAYEEGLWGYRVQGTVFTDRQGYLSSTDFGVAAGGSFPGSYGSWQVSLVNGETWTGREKGKHKDGHGRLSLYPLGGAGGLGRDLLIAGAATVGTYDGLATSSALDRRRFIVLAGIARPQKVTLLGQAVWTRDPADALKGRYPSLAPNAGQLSDGRGVSIFGRLNFGLLSAHRGAKKWELIGRYDRLDPDKRIPDNGLDRWIAGIVYAPNRWVSSLLTFERVGYDARAGLENERRILLQAEVRY